jgi:hypothetical protein
MESYERREPLIIPGMIGNAKSEDVSVVAKELRVQRLMGEMRKNMPLKAAELKGRLAEGMPGGTEEEVNIHIDATPGGEHDVAMKEIEGLMDSGDMPAAKEKMRSLFDSMRKRMTSEEPVATDTKELEGLAEEFKLMQTQVEELITLAGTLTG